MLWRFDTKYKGLYEVLYEQKESHDLALLGTTFIFNDLCHSL